MLAVPGFICYAFLMKILIGDSGATTTGWALCNTETGEIKNFETQGLSPVFLSDEEIEKVMQEEVLPHLSSETSLDKIFFYGAGCARGSRQERVLGIFEKVFPQSKVSVEGDLVAVVRALCGKSRGVIAILGTGSASGLCDHGVLLDQVKSLGFYIGDEGSASHIGRLVLQGYFYREMPEDLMRKFEKMFPADVTALTEKLYASQTPSRYVGTFAKFCSENREEEFIQNLLEKNFQQFIDAHIVKYEGYKNETLHVVGSVAFHFEDELARVLKKNNIQLGSVSQNPLEKLVAYHLEELGARSVQKSFVVLI